MVNLIPPFLTLVGVIIGSYLTYRFGLTSQLRISDHKKRQQDFSDLKGCKFLLMQLYVSRFEALIYSDFHEARWRLAGSPSESIDLQEAQRWMHKSEDLALDIAKNIQELFKIIGSISILFPRSDELNDLIDRIDRFKTPQILIRPFNMNTEQLESWKAKAITDLQTITINEYARPIDNLLNYISNKIDRIK